jgi:cyclic pyranopterin monophosphate synthase
MANENNFSHLNKDGHAAMVDVTNREVSIRIAAASGKVILAKEVILALENKSVPKGDVLATARIAAIMGAKRTSELIPLCHPIGIHGVKVDLTIVEDGVEIEVEIKTADRTGVEMEALTAAAVAALTIIDMTKSMDPTSIISEIKMNSKSGGRNGIWHRGTN